MKFDPLVEFKSLQENDVFTITKVQWWLLKHEDQYNKLNSNWSCPNEGCYHQAIKHCSCYNKHDKYIFIKLFEQLDLFSCYHIKECYFKQQLKIFNNIREDSKKLKEWVVNNETIGADEYFMFLIEYHDYSHKPVHLRVLAESLLGYQVLVDRKDFENTIKFLEIFSHLFWEKEVYPESEILLRNK